MLPPAGSGCCTHKTTNNKTTQKKNNTPKKNKHPTTKNHDLEGLRQSILYFHNLFIYTGDSFRIEDQLVDREKVVTRMTANVLIRETGEPVTMLGINIARIVDGKLVEEWNTWEQTKATEKLKPSALSA